MKVLMKPIEMIAWFSKEDHPIPLRYKVYSEDMGPIVIKVNSIISTEKESLGRNKIYTYHCQGLINDLEKQFELRYEVSNCKWFLSKL